MLEKLQNTFGQISRFNDVILALLIVMIIVLMVVPIPPWLLDSLLAVNLTIGITLLMMSIYIPRVLALSTFPSILLFTTLYRLALNITTTRMILTKAYAGEIILTFGNYVVSGNFIVGAVIFLIILIVQFVVITKGAERVAEVAARFTLDAMPGKQMSIDADLRAGTIDMDQAKLRRSELEKENQLYGAMDGAMKFVKGDAIAGLIIVAINIVAGFAIGVLQKGMTLEKAIKTYSILTIGDGLVSQIPALLISITAGIIVTRVSSDDKTALGGDIGKQVLGQPKALVLGAVVVIGFALMPGFPKFQFSLLGLLLGFLGYSLLKAKEKGMGVDKDGIPAMASATSKGKGPTPKAGKAGEEFSIALPLMLDVASNVQQAISPELLNNYLSEIRKALYHDLGVPFPGIHLRFNDTLENDTYQILLQEVPISQGILRKNSILVKDTEENLKMLGIEYIKDKGFLPGTETLWVRDKLKAKLTKAKIPFMDVSEILSYHLSFVLKKYAAEFIGIQETRFLLENMEAQFAEIVREVQRILPIQKITEVFQRLVQEDISIRNLKAILQSLIDWGQKEKETVLLTEYARSSLKRYISYKFSGGANTLAVYLLDPDIEETMRKAIRQTSAGSYLALDPNTSKKILTAIKKSVGNIAKAIQKPVILTSMDLRRYMRKLIELELYDLAVLSHQELTEEITVQPLGKISLK